jgi:hypothetical protein
MEFHVTLADVPPDLARLESAFRSVDPGVVLDLDPLGRVLRIAAAVTADDIGLIMATAGCFVSPDRIEPQPSICCGGCSG